MTHTRTAWGWIRPDGSYVVDSELESEADAWRVAKGWPLDTEIDDAKREAWRVRRFIVTDIPE